MKKEKTSKPLTLKQESIERLDDAQLDEVAGGDFQTNCCTGTCTGKTCPPQF